MKYPLSLGRAFLALLLTLALLALAPIASAQDSTNARDKKAFFDVNQTPQSLKELRGRPAALPPAAAALKSALGVEGVVSIDPLTGTARAVGRTDGFLTGPSNADASSVALDYVGRNAAALGLTREAVASLELVRDYVAIDGTHHVSYRQSIRGVPVFGNGLKANVAADGRLVNVVGSPLADLSAATSAATIGEGEAIAAAKRDAGLVTIPLRGESAQQVYYRTVDGNRLAYETIVGSGSELYQTVVDAQSGASCTGAAWSITRPDRCSTTTRTPPPAAPGTR